MTKTRKLWALLALVLTFVLAACSTSEDLKSGGRLEAQFGSPYEDIGVDVAFVSTGRIYVLMQQHHETMIDEYDSTNETESLWLRRLDSNGKIVWSRQVESAELDCSSDVCIGNALTDYSLVADALGNVHVSIVKENLDGDSLGTQASFFTLRFNSAGTRLAATYPDTSITNEYGETLPSGYLEAADTAVDSSGNYYFAYYSYERWDGSSKSVVKKYSPKGSLLWRRTSTVGIPSDTFVTSGGSLYVAGSTGLARYTSSGNLVWTKAVGPLTNVAVSGSSIYTRRRQEIRKFDANGKQLWFKTQSGLTSLVLQDIAGDGSGNVYLSGKYVAGTGNWSAMVRKLNSSGTVLWTKTYGTPAYDDALGIATITGSEIYTTGETQGSLAHTNIGGRDAYIRKLNSSGNPLWTK